MLPEYLHVLLNPLPVYGLAMGCLALLAGLLLRSRPARLVARLGVVFLCAGSAWPVFIFGEKAYDNVMSVADAAGTDLMDQHQARAEKTIVVFYVLAALALAAILVPLRWPGADLPLTSCTLVLTLAALGLGAWIAYAGGRIRHEEFRSPAPPAAESKKEK